VRELAEPVTAPLPVVVVVLESTPIEVTFSVGAPYTPLGDEDRGGRSRWWLLLEPDIVRVTGDGRVVRSGDSTRGADSQRGRARRTVRLDNRGFVALPPDPRRTALGPVTFTAPVRPGHWYTLGVGANRILVRIPDVLRPGSVVSIEPTTPNDATIAWSIPTADVPF
jgi:hypothetical protein